jgi:aspartyl protease family protein
MERPHNNRFLEPEGGSGSGMVGWAIKQLAIWGVGGFIVYSVVVNYQLLPTSTSGDASRAPLAAAHVAAAPHASDRPVSVVTNTLVLRAQSNGHVLLTADVNGAPIKFIVDTGATWLSLTREDARRAGIGGVLDYSLPMMTANGPAKAAPVTLRSVRIGQLEIDDVSATVMPEDAGISLLGQSFLQRLQGYEMRGDTLTLTWQ